MTNPCLSFHIYEMGLVCGFPGAAVGGLMASVYAQCPEQVQHTAGSLQVVRALHRIFAGDTSVSVHGHKAWGMAHAFLDLSPETGLESRIWEQDVYFGR